MPLREEPRRWFAIGDPQTTPERFFTVLDREGLLGGDGMLRPDVGLVSMGDHFDFHGDLEEVERSGRAILTWLAAHAPEQAPILAGNHDLSRVMELAFETDASFADARTFDAKREAEFQARFPRIPTPGIAQRDYFSFSEAQRALVERLLLAGRMRLALVAAVNGVPALFTHAGITVREATLLGLGDAFDATTAAAALEGRFARAIDAVREAWIGGARAALDLAPVHVAGTTAREGGGLLYHRPANPARRDADTSWELDRDRPRRFAPSALPNALVQVAGHSPHPRCRRDLAGWIDPSADVPALAVRSLARGEEGREPSYRAGAHARPGTLILIDPGFAKEPLANVALLEIGPPVGVSA